MTSEATLTRPQGPQPQPAVRPPEVLRELLARADVQINGTRAWDMRVNDIAPVLISADTREGFAARFAYSNQEQILQNASGGQDRLSEQRYFIDREVLIGVDQTLNERIRVTNFDVVRRQIKLTFEYGSDFADMFEVRGWVRKERGHRLDTSIYQHENRVVLSYMGLDWMQRSVTF